MGVPIPKLDSVGDHSAEALLDSLKTIDPAERRKHATVFNYWLSIRSNRQFPPIRDLDPLEISDAGPWSVRILASDIDTEVLARAESGTYSIEAAAGIPPAALKRHFLRGIGTSLGLMRARPELQSLVTFRRINLMEGQWPLGAPLDVIFCRNVLIYFDRPTQQRVLERLAKSLKDDGVLVLGHSEGMLGTMQRLQHVGHTIYRKEPPDACDHPRR